MGILEIAGQQAYGAVIAHSQEYARGQEHLGAALLSPKLTAIRDHREPSDLPFEALVTQVDRALKKVNHA
jgi:hypothetical protein